MAVAGNVPGGTGEGLYRGKREGRVIPLKSVVLQEHAADGETKVAYI